MPTADARRLRTHRHRVEPARVAVLHAQPRSLPRLQQLLVRFVPAPPHQTDQQQLADPANISSATTGTTAAAG
jgi:hypothetical protein